MTTLTGGTARGIATKNRSMGTMNLKKVSEATISTVNMLLKCLNKDIYIGVLKKCSPSEEGIQIKGIRKWLDCRLSCRMTACMC